MMPVNCKTIFIDITDACYIVARSSAGFSIHELTPTLLLDASRSIQFEKFCAGWVDSISEMRNG